MHDFKDIENRVNLVIKEMLNKFPDCNYTTHILLWDDGTSSVKCKHGDDEDIHIFEHYEDKLTYEKDDIDHDAIKIDAKGNEFYVKFD